MAVLERQYEQPAAPCCATVLPDNWAHMPSRCLRAPSLAGRPHLVAPEHVVGVGPINAAIAHHHTSQPDPPTTATEHEPVSVLIDFLAVGVALFLEQMMGLSSACANSTLLSHGQSGWSPAACLQDSNRFRVYGLLEYRRTHSMRL